jgi:hypothetical protein
MVKDHSNVGNTKLTDYFTPEAPHEDKLSLKRSAHTPLKFVSFC